MKGMNSKWFSLTITILAGWFVWVSCNEAEPKKSSLEPVQHILLQDTWEITYFFRQQDETEYFHDYIFTFNDDHTVVASQATIAVKGTWSVHKTSDGSLKLDLDFDVISPFDELNGNWNIASYTQTQLRLEYVSGGNRGMDKLTFEKMQN
jgi:hypothetical protein